MVIGVGLGIGGVLWYQSRIKKELCLALEKMEETQKSAAVLEAQKKEQEEKLKQLTQETEAVIKELESLRELDEKVRNVLEKTCNLGSRNWGSTYLSPLFRFPLISL